ncbi:MAG: LutB/LldF family L-lactate oxidation iron-sulfur protein [Bacteroidota bacterium]
MHITSKEFKSKAAEKSQDIAARQRFGAATHHAVEARNRVVREVLNWEALRETAHGIKEYSIGHLADLLQEFERNATANGVMVYWAENEEHACNYILDLARRNNASLIVKSKSMVTEEIQLSHVLEKEGIETVETDLGEFIVQLAGEAPSHITTPAIHKSREDIGRLFSDRLGVQFSSDPAQLTSVARDFLREKFLKAQIGISGGNFAIAETGDIIIVENEGNARLTTTVPRIHVAVIGIEKVIPCLEDLPTFLAILARSGTGQKITSYVSLIRSPKRPGEIDGPEEVHVVLLDNGRSEILADPKMREVLYCIRCGACLNVCPVYQTVGGHTYGSVYPGPIGSVFTPMMASLEESKDLPYASSLCGRCSEICPVKIDIHHLLLWLRRKSVDERLSNPLERLMIQVWCMIMKSAALYQFTSRIGRLLQPVLPKKNSSLRVPPWSKSRDFPRLAPKTFRDLWSEIQKDST